MILVYVVSQGNWPSVTDSCSVDAAGLACQQTIGVGCELGLGEYSGRTLATKIKGIP
jgi:hypothetical protein